ELYLPNDIIDEDGNSVIRSLTLKPATPGNFSGVLADGGTYDLNSGVFSSNVNMQADSVRIDFGEAGIVLADAFTKVSLAVAPFTVPLDGMDVIVTGPDGNKTTVNILGEDEDEGTKLAAGEVLTKY